MKKIFLFAALAVSLFLSSCKDQAPFDTQDANDAPQILVPYETKSGTLSYSCENPDMPWHDSVVVTPSNYTTVNWYLDGQLVWTGTKINKCFPVGTYAVLIEAVTEAGKRTERKGTLSVKPYATDPYAAASSIGRHVAPASNVVLEGKNLSKVRKVILSKDLYGQDVVCTLEPTAQTDAALTIALPELADATYYVRFEDADGKSYGSDNIEVHHGAIVTDSYDAFFPGKAWEIGGINLQAVATIKVDGEQITPTAVTATSITLTAPIMPYNTTHRLSMRNADGSEVLFATAKGAVNEVEVTCTDQVNLWRGPVALDWNADLVKVTKEEMADIAADDTIFVYFDTPAAEYHAFRITTPWWGTPATLETDLVLQIDGFDDKDKYPSPFIFIYDQRCKGLVVERGAMSIVGFGVTINKITYKPADK